MVVLEGTAMLQVGNNQYLQPDYLSPLPTTLDAKKSPLALLAQTCSQIGADPGNITVKSLVSPSEKGKKSTSSNNSSSSSTSSSGSNSSASSHVDPTSNTSMSGSPSAKLEKSDASPEIKLAFKPYEMNVLTTKVNLSKSAAADDRPLSKMSSGSDVLNNNSVSQINNNNNNNNHGEGGRKESRALSPRGSAESPMSGRSGGSVSVKSNDSGSGVCMIDHSGNNCTTPDANRRASSAGTPSDRDRMNGGSGVPITSTSPSAGMMALHKEHAGQLTPSVAYKPSAYGISAAGLPSPSGIDHANPAFRPPFAGAFNHHHAAMLAAAGYSGAAAAAAAASTNPYLGYTRVKTPSGGETLVPICKDPYCTGCQFSAHNHQIMMGSQCPAGCTQCEHQKYMAMALSSMPPAGYPGYPPPSSATVAVNTAASQSSGSGGAASRPYMCNWVVGDSYCGKRCNTTDELLSHLRTHTANLSDPAALALQQQLMPLSGIFPPSSLHHHHRGYPNPPLSPLSAARYHPYVKPGAMPAGLPGSPYNAAAAAAAAFNPAAAFGQYYSPYAAALYGQRIGAAVHQ
ncbi:zinc finger protein Noc [Anopheles ziemanni]|uniref:zinc finger protein Noc n=1 Tax=Anopheles coustani TaxID=139045 RepID=UPI00265ADB35|nr:zinc finger protein Noc [Anopheles coustani]XP_058170944.1 zinc finger protein Noc [Anopheles ziemanni]